MPSFTFTVILSFKGCKEDKMIAESLILWGRNESKKIKIRTDTELKLKYAHGLSNWHFNNLLHD